VDFQAIVIGLLAILIGLAFVFAGFRLFLILLPIWGFFLGFFFGAEMVSTIFGSGFLADITGWVVGFVFALIFAIGSYLWYWLAIAILGGTVGYALGIGLIGFLGISNNFINSLVGIIVGVVFAAVAIWLRLPKYLAIAFTSIGGAFAAIAGLAILFGKLDTTVLAQTGTTIGAIKDLNWLWLAGAVVLTAIGIWYQTVSNVAAEAVVYSSYRNPGTPAAV
jgi:hypothetical protein